MSSPFRHEALFYAGLPGFLEGTLPFIRDGVAAGQPVLVVVDEAKIAALRDELGAGAEGVYFADIADVGTNPGAIISAWHEFVDAYGGGERPLRGIGEPVWPGRSDCELAECHRLEALLNLAFAEQSDFWLLCPYDTAALAAADVAAARGTHPYVVEGAVHEGSTQYRGAEAIAAPFTAALCAAPADCGVLPFDRDGLETVRATVVDHSVAAGLASERVDELVLAVNELATNSVRHADGHGTLRIWTDAASGDLVCEVADAGYVENPLAGRRRPADHDHGGWGLWMAHQLCDLVELRSSPAGTTIRLHARPDQPPLSRSSPSAM